MKILVIEDEAQIAKVIQSGLEQQSFTVYWTPSGTAGLEQAQVGSYDLIILDIMLPDLNGISVLSRLRTAGNTIPVILLTARDSLEDRIAGLDGGADDYLTKPFYIEELVARARAVVRRKQDRLPVIITCAGISINRTSREVWAGKEKVHLTTREYCLLELFVRTPGNVFTRTELLDKVWDLQLDPSTNIVDVYIQRLRSKLADAGITKLIETVRGVGYRTNCDIDTSS